jgi:hypothetical protein
MEKELYFAIQILTMKIYIVMQMIKHLTLFLHGILLPYPNIGLIAFFWRRKIKDYEMIHLQEAILSTNMG